MNQTEEKSKKWHARAEELYRLKEYHVAFEYYRKAIEADPKNANAWEGLALLLIHWKRYNEALECIDNALEIIEKAVKLGPTEETLSNAKGLWYVKGWILERLWKHKEAINSYEKCGNLPDALNDRAYILANLGENPEAKRIIDSIDKAQRMNNPQNPNYLDTEGFILYNLGDYDKALKLFDQAIDEGKEEVVKPEVFFYHKGNVLYAKKDYDGAIGCYDQAIDRAAHHLDEDLNDDFAEAYNAKGAALACKGDHEEALKMVRKAVGIKPALVSAHENLATLSAIGEGGVNFWDFWNTSKWKRVAAVVIVLSAISLISYSVLIGVSTSVTEQTKTTTTIEHKISDTNLVLVGLAVLILLSPQIAKATVGPVELDLTAPQHPSFKSN